MIVVTKKWNRTCCGYLAVKWHRPVHTVAPAPGCEMAVRKSLKMLVYLEDKEKI